MKCKHLNYFRLSIPSIVLCRFHLHVGGGPRVVVSTVDFHARVRGSVPGHGGLKGPEFRILCLEDSVISIISPSSGGSPGPV